MGVPRRSRKPAAQLRVPPDKIFGVGKPLLKNKLPLYSEVGRALMLKAEEDRLKRKSKEIDFKRSTGAISSDLYRQYFCEHFLNFPFFFSFHMNLCCTWVAYDEKNCRQA